MRTMVALSRPVCLWMEATVACFSSFTTRSTFRARATASTGLNDGLEVLFTLGPESGERGACGVRRDVLERLMG
ncbi:hypothetical protein D9M68_812840 [compost metagenome]